MRGEYYFDPNGIGLGLSICEIIAESMGASISYSTFSNAGSSFRLKIPLKIIQSTEEDLSMSESVNMDEKIKNLQSKEINNCYLRTEENLICS